MQARPHDRAKGREVYPAYERVQPESAPSFDPQDARLRETRNADNPPSAPEEESALRWLQKIEEPQMSWPDWDVEDEPDFDKDELGLEPEDDCDEEYEEEEWEDEDG